MKLEKIKTLKILEFIYFYSLILMVRLKDILHIDTPEWGGGHEGGENKTYCQDLRENLTEKGKFLFFYKIIHNFFLEYNFALIFSLNHSW